MICINSKNNEKTFFDKEIINIGSKDEFDYKINTDFECMLTLQYNEKENKCILLNQFNNDKFLFKGEKLPPSLTIEEVCKIKIKDSEEFITIKLVENNVNTNLKKDSMTKVEMQELYGEGVNASLKLKIEQRKAEIEQARIAITKQIAYQINDLTRKISMNSKSGIVLHLALLLTSFVCSFGVANYIMGLPLKDTGLIIQMPTNLKSIFIFAILIYGIGLILKQGAFLSIQNKNNQTPRTTQNSIILASFIFYAAVYVINLLYFMSAENISYFAIFISLFFVLTTTILAMGCGYFKASNIQLRKELNLYEYRQDFETVVKEYQQWIERYINNLSNAKLKRISDNLFNLQLKSVGETIIGILTAPFLAYGVSNTLAMCFPEAAGWLRISSLRISPVFLVLASFMIIFAFFAFVNSFLANRKIQASTILKQDGFSNFMQHGVDIYGLAGVQKLNSDLRKSVIIGLSIIIIEFSMNTSYFMQEMGSDLGGMLLSFLAALVPTAILIAETYMLSNTKFEIFVCNELLAKVDRD